VIRSEVHTWPGLELMERTGLEPSTLVTGRATHSGYRQKRASNSGDAGPTLSSRAKPREVLNNS